MACQARLGPLDAAGVRGLGFRGYMACQARLGPLDAAGAHPLVSIVF